jgi:hypothetical protein
VTTSQKLELEKVSTPSPFSCFSLIFLGNSQLLDSSGSLPKTGVGNIFDPKPFSPIFPDFSWKFSIARFKGQPAKNWARKCFRAQASKPDFSRFDRKNP